MGTNYDKILAHRQKRDKERPSLSSSNYSRILQNRLARDFESTNKAITDSMSNWQDKDTMASNRLKVKNYYDALSNFYGESMTEEQKRTLGAYESILGQFDERSKLYSNYINADAFNKERKRQETAQEYKHLTYNEVQRKLATVTDKDEQKYLKNYTDFNSLEDFDKAIAAEQATEDEYKAKGLKAESAYKKSLTEARNRFEAKSKYDKYAPLANKSDFEEQSDPTQILDDEKQKRLLLGDAFVGSFDEVALGYMNEDMQRIGAYILNTQGEDAYHNYLRDVTDYVRNERADIKAQEWSQYAKDNPVLTTIGASVLQPIVGGIAGLEQAIWSASGHKSISEATGLSAAMSGATAEISQRIKQENGSLPAFAYDVFSTGVPNRIGQMMFGSAYNVVMGMSSFANTYANAVQQGEDPNRAVANALVAGSIEFLTEQMGMEWAFGTSKTALTTILKQALAEGSEEVVGAIAQAVWDAGANGAESEFNKNVAKYREMGYEYDEAVAMARADFAKDVAYQFAVAAASTAPTGGVQAIVTSAKGSHVDADALHSYLQNNPTADELGFMDKYGDDFSKLSNWQKGAAYGEAVQELRHRKVNTTEGAEKAFEDKALLKSAYKSKDRKALKKYNLGKESTDSEGNKISVDNVSTEDGKTVIESNGQKYNADEVTLSENDAYIVNQASKIKNETLRNLYVQNYNGQDIASYDANFELASEYGGMGLDKERLMNTINTKVMPLSVANDIYDAARVEDAEKAIAARKANTDLISKWNGKYKKGNLDLSSLDVKNLTKDEKRVVDFLKVFSTLGMNIKVIKDSSTNISGNYDTATGDMLINLAGKAYIQSSSHDGRYAVKTFFHESTHMMKNILGEEFDLFQSKVREYLGADWADRVTKRMEAHNISEEEAEEEVVARFCEDFYINSDEAEKFFSSMDENAFTRLFNHIKAWFKKVLDGLNEWVKSVPSESVEAQMAREIKKDFEAFRKEWVGMFERSLAKRQAIINGVVEDTTEAIKNNDQKEIESLVGDVTTTKNSIAMDSELADASLKYQEEHNVLDAKDVIELNKSIAYRKGKILPVLKKNKDKLPADIAGDIFSKNSSYNISAAHSLQCVRSLTNLIFIDHVANEVGRPLTVAEQIAASELLAGVVGNQRECQYCYNAADRKAYEAGFGTYLNSVNAIRKAVKKNKKAYKQEYKYLADNYETIKENTSRDKRADFIKAEGKNFPLFTEYLNGRDMSVNMLNRFMHIVNDALNGNIELDPKAFANEENRANALSNPDLAWYIKDATAWSRSAFQPKKRTRTIKVNGEEMDLEYIAYNGNILEWDKDAIKALNSSFGLRDYSYDDFVPAFILEDMQMVTDASVRGLKMLSYNKDVDFARVFAPTGMNINLSVYGVIPLHIRERYKKDKTLNEARKAYKKNPSDETRKVYLDALNPYIIKDEMQGANVDAVKALRKEYDNVGAVFVATNDDMVEWAMAQDWIDIVIPYHIVRSPDTMKYFQYTNYKGRQEDRKAKGWNSKDLAAIPPALHNNDRKTYEKLLEENHLTHRFPQWASNPNYMKLVNETRRPYNLTEPVKPVFDYEAIDDVLQRIEDGGVYGEYIESNYEKTLQNAVKLINAGKTSQQDVEDFYANKLKLSEAISEETYDKMKEHFGTTENMDVAGYMLKDGTLLDFSGKHWGDTTSKTRTVDHRDIQEVLPDDDNGFVSVNQMRVNGNIRLEPEIGGINLAVEPTKEQYDYLQDYVSYMLYKRDSEGVVIDFDDAQGRTINTLRYEPNTSPKQVMNDIRNYFKGKEQSDIMKFHTMYSESVSDEEYSRLAKKNPEKARRVLDQFALENGALSLPRWGTPTHFYHGTRRTDFYTFDIDRSHGGWSGYGFYFSPDKNRAAEYASRETEIFESYLFPQDIAVAGKKRITAEEVRNLLENANISETSDEAYTAFVFQGGMDFGDELRGMKNGRYVHHSVEEYLRYHDDRETLIALQALLLHKGYSKYDANMRLKNEFGYWGLSNSSETVLWFSNDVKSADLITYDDSGNEIPLSKRFEFNVSDMRYSEAIDAEGYVEKDPHKLGLKNDRIDKLLSGGYYGSTNPDYAQAYIAYMSPDDFLKLTTGKNQRALDRIKNWKESEWDAENREDFSIGKFADSYNMQPIQLQIDEHYDPPHGNDREHYNEVYGHEGRHRMWQLKQMGYEQVPVLIFNPDNKYDKKPIDSIRLMPQWFQDLDDSLNDDDRVEVKNLLPFSQGNIDEIKRLYGEGNDAGFRFSEAVDSETYKLLNENENLKKRSAILEEDIKRLEKLVQMQGKVTKGLVIDRRKVEKIAGAILKERESKYDKRDLTNALEKAYQDFNDVLMNKGKITSRPRIGDTDVKESLFGGAFRQFYDIADKVLSESDMRAIDVTYKSIANEIRNAKVKFTEAEIEQAKAEFGNSWSGHFISRINLSQDGESLETLWSRWAEKYPHVFNKDEKNKVVALIDTYKYVKDAQNILQTFNEQENIGDLTEDIYNRFWGTTLETVADKYEVQIKDIKAKHKEAMHDLREQRDEAIKRVRDHKNEVIKQVRAEGQKRLKDLKQHYKDMDARKKDEALRRSTIKKIMATATDFMNLLHKNSLKEPVIEPLKPLVEDFLRAIDFSSKQALGMQEGKRSGTPTKQDTAFLQALNNLGNFATGTNLTEELMNLREYLDLGGDSTGVDDYFGDRWKALVSHVVELSTKRQAENTFVLQQMTSEELIELNDLLKELKVVIKEANNLIGGANNIKISKISNKDIDRLNSIGKAKASSPAMKKLKGFLNWANTLPVYAFKHIGEGATLIFREMMDGMDKLGFLNQQIMDFANETFVNDRDKDEQAIHEETLTVTDKNGNSKEVTFKISDAQLMTLHCLRKRAHALPHIRNGGIQLTKINEKGKEVEQSQKIPLSDEQMDMLESKYLSKEQIDRADKMQKFLSEFSKKNINEVTLKMRGVEIANEEYYFPIDIVPQGKTDKALAEKIREQGIYKLLNSSFTKPLTDRASNPIAVGNIYDVFIRNTSESAKYNAYALPMRDMIKYINYRNYEGNGETVSIYESLTNAFGQDAYDYIIDFLKDLGGLQDAGRGDTYANTFVRGYKVAQVAANLQVAILQPVAITRASLVLPRRYILKAMAMPWKIPKGIKKMHENSGVSLIKEASTFDINLSRGMNRELKKKGIKETIVDWSTKLASVMDTVTWATMWNACEAEYKDKNGAIDKTAYKNEINKRFRDIVFFTQVTDSVMTRSSLMRSQSQWAQMATAFASEPTVSYNVLQDSVFEYAQDVKRFGKAEAFKRNGKRVAKAVEIFLVNAAVESILRTLMSKYRKPDDEEDTLESLWKEFLEQANPLNTLPLFRDIYTLWQGYDVNRMDTESIANAINAFKKWGKIVKGDKDVDYKTIYNTIQSISQLTGVPAGSLMREVISLWNLVIGNNNEDLMVK